MIMITITDNNTFFFFFQADRYVASKTRAYSLAAILDIFGTQSKKELSTKLEESLVNKSTPETKNLQTIKQWTTRDSLYRRYGIARQSKRRDSHVNDRVESPKPDENSDVISNNEYYSEDSSSEKCDSDFSDTESPNIDGEPSNSHSDTGSAHLQNEEETPGTDPMESIGRPSRDISQFNHYKYGGSNYDVSLPPIGLLMEDGKIMPERIDPDIKHKVSEGMCRLSRKIRVEDRLKMEEWIGLEIQLERQMWKSKLQDAMKEIEKHRKTAVLTTSRLHEFNKNLINIYPLDLPSSVFEESICEYVRLQQLISAISDELQVFVSDKRKCLKLLFKSENSLNVCLSENLKQMQQDYDARLEQATLSELNLREKIDALERDILALKHDHQKLVLEHKALTLSSEKKNSIRDRKDSHSSGEGQEVSQKRSRSNKNVEHGYTFSFNDSDHSTQSSDDHQPQPLQSEVTTVTFRLPTLSNDNTTSRPSGTTNRDRTKHKTLRTRHSSPSVAVGIRQCLRCKKPYRVQDNHKKACRYHAKSQVKTEVLKADGTLESTCLVWECCAGDPDASPCCSGEHI